MNSRRLQTEARSAIDGLTLRLIPIFDTNVFVDASKGDISLDRWKLLKRFQSRRGWALSAITAAELLVGIHFVSEEKFSLARRAVELALEISKGRVLAEPRVYLCERILGRPFPEEPISVLRFAQMLRVVACSTSKEDIQAQRVFIKRNSRNTKMLGGFDTHLVVDLLAGPKQQWTDQISQTLREIDPEWTSAQKLRKAHLPAPARNELERSGAIDRIRSDSLRVLSNWLAPGMTAVELTKLESRLDALLELDSYILRQILFKNYNFAKNESDFYDRLQLHYLADENYVFVTRERKLVDRVKNSSQANRIRQFDEYVDSLEENPA